MVGTGAIINDGIISATTNETNIVIALYVVKMLFTYTSKDFIVLFFLIRTTTTLIIIMITTARMEHTVLSATLAVLLSSLLLISLNCSLVIGIFTAKSYMYLRHRKQ